MVHYISAYHSAPRPWENVGEVEYATPGRVDWFNNRRILKATGNIPPAEYELMYYQQLEESSGAA